MVKENLGEVLKELGSKNKMREEFVGERIGVSGEGVCKWERGECDGSRCNLIGVGKL